MCEAWRRDGANVTRRGAACPFAAFAPADFCMEMSRASQRYIDDESSINDMSVRAKYTRQ
ncbi:hypothetical protein PUN4_1610015 [Paraburkholderia unamae]|nr:hypothetical protein PUN4_1610015 [Paraburkholderia unamae]